MAISKTKRSTSKAVGDSSPPTTNGGGMDDSSRHSNAAEWNRTGTTPTSLATSTGRSSQAWEQRERRRKRLKKKQTRAKQLRLICGLGIGLTALILVVVHVEVSMLMQASETKNQAAHQLNGGNLKQQYQQKLKQQEAAEKNPRRMLSTQHNGNQEDDKNIGFHKHAQVNLHLDKPNKKKQENNKKDKSVYSYLNKHDPPKVIKHDSKKLTSKDAHDHKHKKTLPPHEHHPGEPPKIVKHDSKKLTSKDAHDHKHKKNDDPGQADVQREKEDVAKEKEILQIQRDIADLKKKQSKAPAKKEEKKPEEAPPKKEEEAEDKPLPEDRSPMVHAAVNKAFRKAKEQPMPVSANFCGGSPTPPEDGKKTAPAVIILGMEDTATNLLWHILRGVTPEGWVHAPVGLQPPKKPGYEALAEMDPNKEHLFFKDLPLQNHTRWVPDALCLQQQHAAVFKKPTVLGFPWLTTGNTIDRSRALEALKEIKKFPTGSVKVIRFKRNFLNIVELQAKKMLDIKKENPKADLMMPLELLKQLGPWTAHQKAIDVFLEEEEIPHILVHHEELFPFDTWKQMEDLQSKSSKIPLNIDIDYSQVQEDLRPTHTNIESQWESILRFMDNGYPISLVDIISSAKDFDQRDGVFWHQAMSLVHYEKIQQVVFGPTKEEIEEGEKKLQEDKEKAAKDNTNDGKKKEEEETNNGKADKEVAAKKNDNNSNKETPAIQEKRKLDETKEEPNKKKEESKAKDAVGNAAKKEAPKQEKKAPKTEAPLGRAKRKQEARLKLQEAREGKTNLTPLEIKILENETGEKFEDDSSITKKEAEENPKLVKAVNDAVKRAEAEASPMSANFCGTPTAPSHGKQTAPAIIVLGMEDTSTDLFWHVLHQITPEGWVHDPVGLQPPKKAGYDALNEMNPAKEEKFFKDLAINNHGKWIRESLCLQQQHAKVFKKPTVLGFPWLTLGDIAKRPRALEALKAIKKLPPGSVKVIRYRRNILDMVSRQEQHLVEIKEHQNPGAVALEPKNLLKQLTHWTAQQKAIDDLLETESIPHLTVDHEKLFPFNAWKEMLNITSQVESFPLPLNIPIDYSHVPPDLRPPPQSDLENEWESVLEFLQNHNPTSLYDIFSSAKDFDRRDGVFWRQQNRIKNYPKVQQVVTGTHFLGLLRNLEYKHDYFGCACTDKDRNNKLKMFKGWKKKAQ